MEINVVWQSYYSDVPARGYWDMGMLDDLFSRELWSPVCGHSFVHRIGFSELPGADGAVVVLPARRQIDVAERLNADIAKLKWVVLIIMGDEESSFPVSTLQHPNMKLWLMTPIPGQKADRFLIHGYPPDTRKMLPKFKAEAMAKDLQWFFSGQVTHERRRKCVEQLRHREEGYLNSTAGFTQGLDHETYYRHMAMAKIVPCPSGPVTPDSFRVAEALEAGALPLADRRTPSPDYPTNYWENVFGTEPPFVLVDQWDSMAGHLRDQAEFWPANANRISGWWQGYKRKMAYNMEDDINTLTKNEPVPACKDDMVTILMPSSPIPSHPSTEIIDQTIASVRQQFPKAEIIIMIDGVREAQEHRRADYEAYKQRLLWKCNFEWKNVLPLVFDRHTHQAGMTRKALELVKTPLILFVEHDTPLVTDMPFEWDGLLNIVLTGEAHVVRFLHESRILPDYEYLMLDTCPKEMCGIWVTRTVQWSQRPHLSTTAFYRRIIQDHFSPEAVTMIEDRMHGIVQNAYNENRMRWFDFRIVIYCPDMCKSIQRSTNLDGRKHESKFEEQFKF